MAKYIIDYVGLETFLKGLELKQIERDYYKPKVPLLDAAITMDDIEWFSKDKDDIDSFRIIDYGMPFLVDALGNDLSICFLSRRKYKLPNGRAVACKFDRTIIDDCRAIFGTPLNGYWVIPKQFITKSK